MSQPTPSALIGHTGYVGSTLLRQRGFDALFHSANIDQLDDRPYAQVVCCAAPAQKRIANRDPQSDRDNIERLMQRLDRLNCQSFVLISTVDVFRDPVDVDEDSPVIEDGLHAYGAHRRLLEQFVESRFQNPLIVRLPGLVGPGLRKNVIFDFLHHNGLASIDSRAVFQFYPMVNLWFDIERALLARLRLVHLTAEPLSVGEVALQGFGRHFEQEVASVPARYNLCTRHAELFGAHGRHQYARRESIQAIRAYAQSEPLSLPVPPAGSP
jgi:hypothetical protein